MLRQWDEIKRAEKGHQDTPFLHGVGQGLPALLRAAKLQKKASKVGFDWPEAKQILDKIQEELDETREAKCRPRITSRMPVAVTKMCPISAASSIVITLWPSSVALSAAVGLTSVTMTLAPRPLARIATPRPQ